jgi:hypothetical protein
MTKVVSGECLVERDGPYPCLFRCLEDISHDGGGGTGHTSYILPGRWDVQLPWIEAALAELTEEQRNAFAIGEQGEVEDMLNGASLALRLAHLLLNEFFLGI